MCQYQIKHISFEEKEDNQTVWCLKAYKTHLG